MSKNNQKEKLRSVFNYKYFQLAVSVPLVIGFILMIFIWQNDNLSLEWPTKKTLETFLTYMSVPLWIMGSSIPFATLAAANFRAVQFQENLNFQKRNTERQEYEHAIDLYHKELQIFTACFSSTLSNHRYKNIQEENATLIFTKAYEKPSRNCLNHRIINPRFFRIILLFQETMLEVYDSILIGMQKFESYDLFIIMLKLIDPSYASDVEDKTNKKITSEVTKEVSLMIYSLYTLDSALEEISALLGVQYETIKTGNLSDVVQSYVEICGLIRVFEDSGFCISDDEICEINKDSKRTCSRQNHKRVMEFTEFLLNTVGKLENKGNLKLATQIDQWSR